jgi:hypothetical protein
MPYRTQVAFAGLLAMLTLCCPARGGVVINQLYGGGGNSGSIYKNDFIELFNADTVAVSLSGWSVQYASALGSTWQSTPLTGTLQPGGFLLIAEATGGFGTTDLPTPDIVGTLNLANAAGKVALVSNTVLLSGICPAAAGVVDFVGYGAANCFEGSAPAAAPSNTVAAVRLNRCVDSNDNSADFQTASPTPRNTSVAATPCPSIGYAVLQFPLDVTATPCQTTPVYGRVYVAGVTDANSNPAPGLRAQVGYGPDGSDPAAAAGWIWVNAIPNPGFVFTDNNDEYEGQMSAHASGTFDYAYRWSYNQQSWIYADGGNGTTDGYSAAAAGSLTADGDVIYCDRFDAASF